MYGYKNEVTYHAMLHVDSNYDLVKTIEYFCEKQGLDARQNIYNIIKLFIYNNKNVKDELLNIALNDVCINEIVDNYNDYMEECQKELKEGV